VTQPVRGLPSLFAARLNVHLVACSECDTVVRVERATVDLDLLALEAAGWRRIRGTAVCPSCVARRPVEPRTPRQRYEVDPSPARQALAQYARRARGDAQRWARTLLAEWLDEKKDA
jgi:hypothetical protein